VQALLAQMTLDEKSSWFMVGPLPIDGAAIVPGIPRLGIPAVNYADASSGVNVRGSRSTPLPDNLALAATWDMGLAHDYGARSARNSMR
jgi:beta-glucosidase